MSPPVARLVCSASCSVMVPREAARGIMPTRERAKVKPSDKENCEMRASGHASSRKFSREPKRMKPMPPYVYLAASASQDNPRRR